MNKETRAALTKAPEFRTYKSSFEIRDVTEVDSHLVRVEGYASMVDKPYVMYDMFGEYSETIARGAFTKTLAERADVAFLANHEGLTMARTTNGTLELSEDVLGLRQSATLDSRRSDVNDLVLAIQRGDIDQMSFAFRVLDQDWNDDFDERTIREVSLDRGDVSAVNYGANPNTVIGARAFPHAKMAQLSKLATALESGRELDLAQRTQLARMVRSLPVDGDEDKQVLREVSDDLTGYNLALALKAMIDSE